MALFLSTVTNKVDRKGRVSVPSLFRNAIVDPTFHGIVAFPSFRHPALQCGSMAWMEELSSGVDGYDLFSEDRDDLTAAVFAKSKPLPFDGDGRIVLPEDLRQHAKIKDQAVFVGRGKLFEIWAPNAYDAFDNAATQRLTEKKLTLAPNGKGGTA